MGLRQHEDLFGADRTGREIKRFSSPPAPSDHQFRPCRKAALRELRDLGHKHRKVGAGAPGFRGKGRGGADKHEV